MDTLDKFAEFTGRAFLAAIFLISGLGKIGNYAATQAYMLSAGVPGQLLPFVIILEVAGAVAIVAGWQTRIAALVLAGFSILAALLFHADFAEHLQRILFLKNIGIAGGFLLLYVRGAGPWSFDYLRAGASEP